MSTVNEIVQYIKGCSDFFKSQDGLLSDDLRRDSITSMAATIVRNIMGVKELDAAGASSLNGSIADSSFPATEKSAFAVAVVERLTAPAAAGGGDDASKQQVLTAPYNFLTESDWRYVRDDGKSIQQVCVRVRERFRLIGLTKMSEKTLTGLASMIAAAREPDMSQIQLKSVVDDLKQAIVVNEVPPIRLHIFPTSPTDLPEALFRRAYSEEAPCPQELPEHNIIFKRCPCRVSHKSLKTSPDARVARIGSPSAASAASLEPMARAMMPLFEGVMANFAQQMLGPNRRIAFDGKPADGLDTAGIVIHGLGGGADRMQLRQGDALVPKDPRLEQQLVLRGPAADMVDAEHIDDEGHDKDTRPVADIVADMERIACGTDGAIKIAKKPAAPSTSLLKRPSAGEMFKKPASIGSKSFKKPVQIGSKVLKKPVQIGSTVLKKPSSSSKTMRLGCGRCRGSHVGCLSCREPSFAGKRYQR